MNIKVGQVYRVIDKFSKRKDFIITELEPTIKARFVNEDIDWVLNLQVVENGYFRLLTKLEKALK